MTQFTLDSLLEGLTDPQREAVCHVDGPLLVLAGPGSGKTTVVTRRIASLIAQGIAPWQVLALTFTNKAAGEMRERIDRMLPEGLPGRRGLTVATFHSFCARLLRRYAIAAGLSDQYTIYDSADQRDAIKAALAEVGLSTKNWAPGSVAAQISHAKNQLLDAAGFAAEASDFYSRSIAKIFSAYERILKANDALDFDDLLVRTACLLRSDESVRNELQARYEYLLIDEYQDTNHAQFVIAQVLASIPGRTANICVVGDPDQSIYGWRGADIRNILEFEQHYPDAHVVPLGQNFRSTGHIVAVADELIRNNRKRKDKRLHTELGDGDKPTVVTCRDEHHEAQVILEEFRRLHDDAEVPWKEMAVLYRVNALSRVMEDAFRDAQVPYLIARGTAFYERKEIKDALCYLRLVANPQDEVALRRIINTPPRGIGGVTLKKVELFAINNQCSLAEALHRVDEVGDVSPRSTQAVHRFTKMIDGWHAVARGEETGRDLLHGAGVLGEGGGLADIVERVISESGLEKMYRNATAEEDQQRLENLGELVSAAAEYEPPVDNMEPEEMHEPPSAAATLAAYLESVALVSDADAIDPAQGCVTLMTLHAAKGLEFDAVAVAGLEEGMLPHLRAAESPDEMEEERRLCFVGITRARRRTARGSATPSRSRGTRTIPTTTGGGSSRAASASSSTRAARWTRTSSSPRAPRPSPRQHPHDRHAHAGGQAGARGRDPAS